MNKPSRRGLIEEPLRSADQWIWCPIKSVSHRSCSHSLQRHDNSNISILILHLHVFLTICLVCLFLLLVVKEFKAVSGHNKYVGSLEGVTTMEKEKFPKNFWPDVSVCSGHFKKKKTIVVNFSSLQSPMCQTLLFWLHF